MRIDSHPLLDFSKVRKKKVRFYFNGKEYEGYEGEPIAVALYANGIKTLSRSTKLGRPRGLFCAIGKCGACRVTVNGVPNVRACQEPVREGIKVYSIAGLGSLERSEKEVPKTSKPEEIEVEVLVVGAGPAGLMASLKAADLGAKVLLVDYSDRIGGQLTKQTHKFFGWKKYFAGIRGFKIAEMLEKEVKRRKNIEVWLRSPVIGYYDGGYFGIYKEKKKVVYVRPKKAIICPGAYEKFLVFENNDLPGIMGAGAAQTLMHLWGVKPGNKVIVIGAGNVGLIVSYQMTQAGVKVEAIVEALPRISGYFVHAAKVRRLGIPILTGHTIVRAEGEESVRKAVIAKIDENWKPIPGTEREFEVDAIIVSVGMLPDATLTRMIGVSHKFVKELGGFVPVRNENMETDVPGIYVAGDVSCIEEATTAMLEGIIAGISAAISLGHSSKEGEKELKEVKRALEEFRSGPKYEHIRRGLSKLMRG